MEYTDLLVEADNLSLITKDKPLHAHDGCIKKNRIAIRKDMPEVQKKCVLAEELGHYHLNTGDILDQSSTNNRKQEFKARLWAYNKLIGLSGIISSYRAGCRNTFEIADYLNITEEFLQEALSCYRQKYGVYTKVDNYVVYFEPTIGVFELIEDCIFFI